ncbi:hypothetical protein DEO72_LG6g2211 [Vigna unguiculata]|uniref:Uncharacterized protein n=1 Tax=Vigna unguiculata TaxID=3917 RepID=A0A4D6MAR9_VIGUN|nr:hypothetical protein DEO72_LG6g2211 [Vigna unguiculata]
MCADPDTSERLGVDAGLRGSLPSGRSNSHYASVPALLQDLTHDVERLGFVSWGEQEPIHSLPRLV